MAGYSDNPDWAIPLESLDVLASVTDLERMRIIISGNRIMGRKGVFTPQVNMYILNCLMENLPPAVKGPDGFLREIPIGSKEAMTPEAEELRLIRVIDYFQHFASLYTPKRAKERLEERFGDRPFYLHLNPNEQRDAVREQITFLEGDNR